MTVYLQKNNNGTYSLVSSIINYTLEESIKPNATFKELYEMVKAIYPMVKKIILNF